MNKHPKPAQDLLRGPDGRLFTGIGPGAAAEFAKEYFPLVQRELRIASGFFSVSGYELGWEHIPHGVQLHILVGIGEWASEQAKKAVIVELKRELKSCEEEPGQMFEAVQDLVARIHAGKFTIRDARGMETPFHCKFYICDTDWLWHGSANYSRKGLQTQAEQVEASHDKEHIERWIRWYDEVAKDAQDLLAQVLAVLEEWITMASPFDAYLMALSLLLGLRAQTRLPGAHEPVYYQQAIIASALRQMDRYGGALLVVATGLGKTVIGAEIAARLQAADVVDRVLLFAPKGVHAFWKRQLVSRRVFAERFANDILFNRPSTEPHHQVCQVEDWLARAGPQSLILVDEAHRYRNELHSLSIKGKRSRVFRRLRPAVEHGARILLLTASPYSTNREDLNSLLHLLPHNFPDPFLGNTVWRANTLDEFAQLPPVTVFGLRHLRSLACARGDVDEEGQPYVEFAGERRYLPRTIEFHEAPFSLPFHAAIQKAFDQRCFSLRRPMPQKYLDEEGNEQASVSDPVFNSSLDAWLSSPAALKVSNVATTSPDCATLDAWLSSPAALKEAIEKNLNTPGGIANHELPLDGPATAEMAPPVEAQIGIWMEETAAEDGKRVRSNRRKSENAFDAHLWLDRSHRAIKLEPIAGDLNRIGRKSGETDDKLSRITTILHLRCVTQRDKAVIFVNLLSTAIYLHTFLQKIFRDKLRVTCTVRATRHGPRLLNSRARGEVLKRFSPRSHDCEPREYYDVLICTDADGIGVNLQDANTLVHYDLPASADPLVQRLGRVLRLTTDSTREIHVYTLVPTLPAAKAERPGVQGTIGDRLARMRRRERRSRRITDSVSVRGEDELDIPREGVMRVDDLLQQIDALGDVQASLATHMAVLESHRSRVDELRQRNTLHSARHYAGDEPRVVVVLRHQDRYHAVVFDPEEKQVLSDDSLDALGLLHCETDEPRAAISVREVLLAATQAVEAWCGNRGVPLAEAERVCAVYLEPADHAGDLDRLLTPASGRQKSAR